MKIYFFLITAFLTVFFSSCLKDKNIDNRQYGMDGIEDIQLVEISGAPGKSFALNYIDRDTSFALVSVHLNSPEPATEDIKVTLTKNDALVADYNANNATSFEVAPSSIYELDNLTVTIPKGAKDGILTIKCNPADLSIGEYALGFTIASVSSSQFVLSKNYKDIFVYLGVKNKYDGVYRLQGQHNRPLYNFPYDTEIHLVTTSPRSVIFYWPEVKSNGHPIGIGPDFAMSWYGAGISPIIVFNTTTDLVTDVYNNPPNTTVITMFTGAGSRISKYDPATKGIVVDWNYNNNPDRAFFDNLIYIGPRP